ncbi:hypothetical protein RHMOL_Rhmol03G0143700 [Rhododendron molle]|uniref:Uncharacterized protein n=1 Tax=Rhododendron molle TaxID=49168 RepID=A0ACC0PEK8_RHOML|nr:hypothetical protein RHMOL_Rhmol03G0143700 [Rhododendron molle]
MSRNLNIPRHGVGHKNLEHAFSHWSIDTHSFVWAWGESGLSLEDVAIPTCLSLHGVSPLDPDNLSSIDQRDVIELRRLEQISSIRSSVHRSKCS